MEPINDILKERGISIYKLSKELNISYQTVKGWCEEGRRPIRRNIKNLSNYLKVPIGDLFIKGESWDDNIQKENPSTPENIFNITLEKMPNEFSSIKFKKEAISQGILNTDINKQDFKHGIISSYLKMKGIKRIGPAYYIKDEKKLGFTIEKCIAFLEREGFMVLKA